MCMVIYFIAFIGCKNSSVNEQKIIFSTNNCDCVSDTILKNGTKIKYRFSEKDRLCYLEIITNRGVKSKRDSFYYDTNDCRMVPKLLYSTQNTIFFLSGTGSYYRVLYRYEYDTTTITKDVTQFDICESEPSNSSDYYPFKKNNTLSVLIIDAFHNVKNLDTKKVLWENKIKCISILKNKLIITTDVNEIINIDL